MATPQQLLYLRLLALDELPRAGCSRLIRHSGSLAALQQADEETFAAFRLDSRQRQYILDQLAQPAAGTGAFVQRAEQWLDQDPAHHLVCYCDPCYPPLLKQIDCPPPVLFVSGDPAVLSAPQLAMVGSRKASGHGLQAALWLAEELAGLGLCITSGLAAGIDSQAHRGALAAGGRSVAVIGTGIDRIYPPANLSLAASLSRQGALVSEFPLGTPPLPGNFPQRNRIIAGLSLGVIVVEAALRSGSLITARQAMEYNREVFAVPGSLFAANAKGCHRLIRDGAKLVDSVQSIMEELLLPEPVNLPGPAEQSQATQECNGPRKAPELIGVTAGKGKGEVLLSADEKRVLQLLGADPCAAELVAENTGMVIARVNRVLSALELKGLLHRAGGRYQRVVARATGRKFDTD